MAKKSVVKKVQNRVSNLSGKEKAGIGIGLTAAALAAIGGYFFYGSKNAAQNRKKVKGWMVKAKGEVLERIEEAKNLTREDYELIVDDVVKSYKTLKNASANEVSALARELKADWKHIEKSAHTPKKAGKKVAAKVARKTPKKK